MNIALGLAIALVTAPTLPALAASCALGATPSYADITYVAVRQGSLTGQLHPEYSYEGISYPAHGAYKARFEGTLSARRAVKLLGNVVAVDPQRTLGVVVAVLERDRFFEMQLTPTFGYIDGPEDAVTVVRCGVKTSLGTVSEGGEVKLDDEQGRAFFRLLDDLRNVIFSEQWTEPTPAPGSR